MSVILRGFGGTNVAVRGYGEPVLGPLCWIDDVVAYANNPASFTPTTLASKTPVMRLSVGVGTTSAAVGYAKDPLAGGNPVSYTAGVGFSSNEADYSDDGDTYDASKDCG